MSIDRGAIYARDGGLCGFCGEHVRWEDLDLDHVVPKALGGRAVPSNLRVAHGACNRSAAWLARVRVREWDPQPKYRFICVFPTDLGAKVKALAARERRTITAQVQLLVEQALSQETAVAA